MWSGFSIPTSSGCGSFTPSTISDASKTALASGRIVAPWASYSLSGIVLPSPAPDCTSTSCPRSVSSRTPAGVSDTRYSSVLISVGTPTFIASLDPSSWVHQLARPQREPELDPVPGLRQVAAGELLHPPDPVAQRVPVAVELARGALPLAVLLD